MTSILWELLKMAALLQWVWTLTKQNEDLAPRHLLVLSTYWVLPLFMCSCVWGVCTQDNLLGNGQTDIVQLFENVFGMAYFWSNCVDFASRYLIIAVPISFYVSFTKVIPERCRDIWKIEHVNRFLKNICQYLSVFLSAASALLCHLVPKYELSENFFLLYVKLLVMPVM